MNVSRDTSTSVRLDIIDADPEQPRRNFNPTKLAELAASIDANGLVAPILLRPSGDRFIIVHGERRYRAVQSLGWADVPAVVRDIAAADVPWIQVAENLNRDDLSPIEEARSFAALVNAGSTQADVAARLGKTRTYVTQKMRLLSMPAPLVLLVDRGALSEGHARQLLRIKSMYTENHTIGRPDDGLEYAKWAMPWAEPDAAALSVDARLNLTLLLLTQCRPVDWPAAYGFRPNNPISADAAEALSRDIAAQGHTYPRWVLPAVYYAILAVEAKASVATTQKMVDQWEELVYAAVTHMFVHDKPETMGVSPTNWQAKLWWGHHSDLRHAGLLDHGHIDTLDALDACMHDLPDGGATIAIPSMYGAPGSPQHGEYGQYAEVRRGDR
jgi:ParB/RepB/Spo0J family partition protein